MGLIKEFKEFAVKGNAIDLAVAVVIGGAFGKIVSSLVADVIMPLIGILINGINFTEWKIVLKGPVDIAPAITLNIGILIQTLIDFTIIAFCLFIVVRIMNKVNKKKNESTPAPAPTPPEPSNEEKLLTEIRDLLKNKQ
jgi:large conductance mechanosensitive channel